jgi:hypothetical protein
MIWVIRGKSSLLATTPVGCIIKHKAQDSTDDGGATPLHYTERKMDINKGCNTRISKNLGAFARRQQSQDSTFASSPGRKADDSTASNLTLITIHRHTLGLSAQLALRRRADGPAVRLSVAVLLQRHQLLRAEGLVVDLGRRLDEVLQVCPCEEVAEEDKLAMVLVLDVDNAPAILAASDLAAGDDDGLLGTDDREGDDVLEYGSVLVSNPAPGYGP